MRAHAHLQVNKRNAAGRTEAKSFIFVFIKILQRTLVKYIEDAIHKVPRHIKSGIAMPALCFTCLAPREKSQTQD